MTLAARDFCGDYSLISAPSKSRRFGAQNTECVLFSQCRGYKIKDYFKDSLSFPISIFSHKFFLFLPNVDEWSNVKRRLVKSPF